MTGTAAAASAGLRRGYRKVLAACSAHGVAVEINANPWPLDLDWRWHRRALELGCMMSINPDAHSTREIDLTHWGIEAARKGGVPPGRVLNAFTLQQLTQYLKKRKAALAHAASANVRRSRDYRFEAGATGSRPRPVVVSGIRNSILACYFVIADNLPLTKFTPGRARM